MFTQYALCLHYKYAFIPMRTTVRFPTTMISQQHLHMKPHTHTLKNFIHTIMHNCKCKVIFQILALLFVRTNISILMKKKCKFEHFYYLDVCNRNSFFPATENQLFCLQSASFLSCFHCHPYLHSFTASIFSFHRLSYCPKVFALFHTLRSEGSKQGQV